MTCSLVTTVVNNAPSWNIFMCLYVNLIIKDQVNTQVIETVLLTL